MQVPVVGTWAIRDASVPPRAGQSNSAQRVAAVRRRGGLDADVPAARHAEEFAAFRTGNFDVVPGGETATDVSSRMVAALQELLAGLAPGECAVAVSHGAAIRDTVPVLLGWPVEERSALHGLDNCGWVELDRAEPGAPFRLHAYNRVASR